MVGCRLCNFPLRAAGSHTERTLAVPGWGQGHSFHPRNLLQGHYIVFKMIKIVIRTAGKTYVAFSI